MEWVWGVDSADGQAVYGDKQRGGAYVRFGEGRVCGVLGGGRLWGVVAAEEGAIQVDQLRGVAYVRAEAGWFCGVLGEGQ